MCPDAQLRLPLFKAFIPGGSYPAREVSRISLLAADHAGQPAPERADELEAQERHDNGDHEANQLHRDPGRVDGEVTRGRVGLKEGVCGLRGSAQTEERDCEQALHEAAVFDFVIHV